MANAFVNLRNAGYSDSQWTLLAQTYSSPLPNGAQIRYSESGYTRQSTGGCGVWNKDADWSNSTVVSTLDSTVTNAVAQSGMSNVKVFDGRTG